MTAGSARRGCASRLSRCAVSSAIVLHSATGPDVRASAGLCTSTSGSRHPSLVQPLVAALPLSIPDPEAVCQLSLLWNSGSSSSRQRVTIAAVCHAGPRRI